MADKINIAAIASYRIYPAVSGGQKCIALFYKYLSKLLPVTIISVPENTTSGENIVKTVSLLNSSRFRYINPLLFFRLKKYIRQNNITHLILEHPYYGWLGILLKSACKVKLVVHSHNIEALRFKSTGRWWWQILWNYERWTHRYADINFFITEEDLEYAKKYYRLDEKKCHIITYGTEIDQIPSAEEKLTARKMLAFVHGVKENELLLLFNGFFDYKPNLNALDTILEKINPILLNTPGLSYKIFICGKNLPASYNELKAFSDKNIIFPGFVPDIRPYFTGTDIFINPVEDGGGIKTKLVEALGYNLSAVCMEKSAIGVPSVVVKDKMIVVKDGDFEAFCKAILSSRTHADTGNEFFNHFFWGNIAEKAAQILNES